LNDVEKTTFLPWMVRINGSVWYLLAMAPSSPKTASRQSKAQDPRGVMGYLSFTTSFIKIVSTDKWRMKQLIYEKFENETGSVVVGGDILERREYHARQDVFEMIAECGTVHERVASHEYRIESFHQCRW
jgi:hypothetical protein